MKYLFFLFFLPFFGFAVDVNQITYEYLFETDLQDHVPHFRRLFREMKIHGMIQCGCNLSTKYFLEHCDQVVTIEFLSPGSSDRYFIESLKLFKKSKNWLPVAFNADLKNESFNKACAYQCAKHKNYALIDPQYVFDLDAFFKKQLEMVQKKKSEVDVVFVKTYGIYLRGDMVNLFLARGVPIVVATDTRSDHGPFPQEGVYGWFKIYSPPIYEKIFLPFGSGTTFWIRKELTDLIDSMKRYRDLLVEYEKTGQLKYDCELLKALADSV